MVKSILLLYRENMDTDGGYNSKDLILNILKQIEEDKKLLQGEGIDNSDQLKQLIYDAMNNTSVLDKDQLELTLSSILKANTTLVNKIVSELNKELGPIALKNSVLALRDYLTKQYKQKEIANIISKAAYRIRTGNIEGDISSFTDRLINNLETLNTSIASKKVDKAIVTELNISNKQDMASVISKAKANTNGKGRFKTGWEEINRMLGGGFRAGETVLISALQHNYKSGMLRSLFAQLCMYNKPVLKDKSKKPLNVFISFEDDADIALEFFYKYLYFSEYNQQPDLSNVSIEEIGDFINSKLSITGYNVMLLRVNPAEWTYRSLLNKILEYEAEGYEIHVLVTDYLSKLPTTYCEHGPTGTAFRYMLTTVRDYTSSKNILFINAHQLSTEAKMLVRNQIGELEFVKFIANKGYYEGSRQLDQVVDLEIQQHIAKTGEDEAVLTLQRGKRRYPEIIPNADKYAILPFPSKIPCIPPNLSLDGTYVGFKYNTTGYTPPENQGVTNTNNNIDDILA